MVPAQRDYDYIVALPHEKVYHLCMDKAALNQFIAHGTYRDQSDSSPLVVDSRLSGYIGGYEKIRNIIGFQGEHLWRRHAIERIIQRFMRDFYEGEPIAQRVLCELVLAEYVEEGEITYKRINRVDALIAHFVKMHESLVRAKVASRRTIRIWLYSVMAVSIEEALGMLQSERALIAVVVPHLLRTIQFPQKVSEEQKEFFILLACGHTLAWTDRGFVAHFAYKRWHAAQSDHIDVQARHLWKLKSVIDSYEKSFLYQEVIRFVKPHVIVHMFIGETIKRYHGNIKPFAPKINSVFRRITNQIRLRMHRRYINSFIYIAVTKLTLIIYVETLYDIWADGYIHYPQLVINLTVPICLFVLLISRVRVTDKKNTAAIIKEACAAVEGKKTSLETRIRMPVMRTSIRYIFYEVLVAIAYIITYGGIIVLLYLLQFNFVGGFFFLTFITMVTFLTIRMKFHAERFRIVVYEPGVLMNNLSLFALPILSIGRWIVDRVGGRNNVVIILVDYFIERPYKAIVYMLRDFTDFIREQWEMVE